MADKWITKEQFLREASDIILEIVTPNDETPRLHEVTPDLMERIGREVDLLIKTKHECGQIPFVFNVAVTSIHDEITIVFPPEVEAGIWRR